ncbi:MAG: hypothetical protein AAF349_20905 [Cyanobacteria bacterium P01_A01_bin.68]
MSIHNNLEKLEFELKLISDETSFYLDFVSKLPQHKSASILIFGIIPYLSLFVVETYSYIKNKFPYNSYISSIKYMEIIRNSRMRTKFFDDKMNQISGTFELLDWISEFHKEWHIHSHKNPSLSLKKTLQPDLGLFTYNTHIIGSTHTGLLLTGLEKENISQGIEDITEILGHTLHSVSHQLGKYLSLLSKCPELKLDNINSFKNQLHDDQLFYIDVKSEIFFKSIFNCSEHTSINFSLLLFLSTINFFEFILQKTFQFEVNAPIHCTIDTWPIQTSFANMLR